MAHKKTAKVPELYTRLRQEIKGDGAACAVVALAAVTGLSGKTVQEALFAEGRKPGRGTYKWQQERALQALGYKITKLGHKELMEIVKTYPGKHSQLQNVTTHHPRRFKRAWENMPDALIFTESHVSAFVDGKMVDWTIRRSKRVLQIWIVEKSL